MSEYLESFKKFLKEREKASQAYVSGDGEPLVKISATKSPATFFSPGGDLTEGAKKVSAREPSRLYRRFAAATVIF